MNTDKEKMKICMLVHQDYFRDGRVRRYAESLAEDGVKVDILCVKSNYEPETNLHENIHVFVVPFTRRYKKSKSSYILEYISIMFCFSLWLFWLNLKNGYNIIHIHNMPDFLVFTALFPKLCGSKIILDIHDPSPEFYTSKFADASKSMTVRLLTLLERFSIGISDAVITANHNFKKNLVKRGIPENKITVVINVPDTRLFDREKERRIPREQPDKFILIYPGTIAPRYGLNVPISALPVLIKKIPNLVLRIVGAKNYHVAQLEALANKLGVRAYLEILPVVPIENVARVIAQADIGIYPAYPDAHMDIATPSKVLEFAYMGIPIVASRITVLVDYFTEKGISFFAPGNSDEFSRCIFDLYENQEKREEMIRYNDQNFVQRYKWQYEYQKYTTLLKKICQKKLKGSELHGEER